MDSRRTATVLDEYRTRRYLHSPEAECDGYPHPLAWDAWRSYFCKLTGGCKWTRAGSKYVDDGILGPGLRCRKCHTTLVLNNASKELFHGRQ